MGAQVYNQMIQRVHQPPAPPRIKTSMRPALSRVNRVKCNLFGKVESDVVKQFVDQKIKEQIDSKSKKWGFDFANGRPMADSSIDWRPVSADVPVAAPAMITLTNAAHVIPKAARRVLAIRRSNSTSSNGSSSSSSSILSRPLSMEELMDERARRANEGERREDGVDSNCPLDESFSTASTLSPAEATAAAVTSEESDSEAIDTYPTPRSSARLLRKLRRSGSPQRTATAEAASPPPRLRQPQITEFMKERKRLSSSAAASVVRISAKKVRLMVDGPSSSSAGASTSSSN